MLSPDKEYYLPKDAEEVALKIVCLMENAHPQQTRALDGIKVGRFLQDYLELSSGLSYSATGLWLYETQVEQPKFTLQAINYIDAEHFYPFYKSRAKFFELAQRRIDDMQKKYSQLIVRHNGGGNIALDEIPNLGYSSLRELGSSNNPKNITEQYLKNFTLLADKTFGEGLHPEVGGNHHNEKFLGGTIAFVDPLSY